MPHSVSPAAAAGRGRSRHRPARRSAITIDGGSSAAFLLSPVSRRSPLSRMPITTSLTGGWPRWPSSKASGQSTAQTGRSAEEHRQYAAGCRPDRGITGGQATQRYHQADRAAGRWCNVQRTDTVALGAPLVMTCYAGPPGLLTAKTTLAAVLAARVPTPQRAHQRDAVARHRPLGVGRGRGWTAAWTTGRSRAGPRQTTVGPRRAAGRHCARSRGCGPCRSRTGGPAPRCRTRCPAWLTSIRSSMNPSSIQPPFPTSLARQDHASDHGFCNPGASGHVKAVERRPSEYEAASWTQLASQSASSIVSSDPLGAR
jgi:hypothetical protein